MGPLTHRALQTVTSTTCRPAWTCVTDGAFAVATLLHLGQWTICWDIACIIQSHLAFEVEPAQNLSSLSTLTLSNTGDFSHPNIEALIPWACLDLCVVSIGALLDGPKTTRPPPAGTTHRAISGPCFLSPASYHASFQSPTHPRWTCTPPPEHRPSKTSRTNPRPGKYVTHTRQGHPSSLWAACWAVRPPCRGTFSHQPQHKPLSNNLYSSTVTKVTASQTDIIATCIPCGEPGLRWAVLRTQQLCVAL